MRINLIIVLLLIISPAFTQNLQAIHGSPYAGSMAPDYNPAGILNAPYRWDLTIAGVQAKTMSNTFYLEPYNLLPGTDTIYAKSRDGYFSRYAHTSATVNLLHFRYMLNEQSAFSVGINIRSYAHARTSPVAWSDTITRISEFAALNRSIPTIQALTQSSGWLEFKLGYARVLSQNQSGRWQGGVQLRAMRALSGIHARLYNVYFEQEASPVTPDDYRLTDGNAIYGYSNNYDKTNNDQTTGANIKAFLSGMTNTIGMDLGVEYIRYWEDANDYAKPEPHDYNWKFSAALLDIGKNKYIYGRASAHVFTAKQNVYASTIQNKFTGVENIHQFSDSLKSIAGNYDTLRGGFAINNPTRLVLNFDKSFERNLFVNAELQWSFGTLDGQRLNTKELTTFAITPRWEKKEFGVYLPFQYTLEGNTWVGLAGKAGPLLVGLHNLGWLLGKKSFPNGGGYVTLQIRSGNKKEKDADCPRF
jgi:hypothetical protein